MNNKHPAYPAPAARPTCATALNERDVPVA